MSTASVLLIRYRPEVFADLLLLETLDVQRCILLEELPSKLNNLKHLRLPQHTLPKNLGELHSLQTISPILFISEEGDGRGIGELEHLSELRGILRIHKMENIRSIEEFEKSKLKEKKYINHVIMKWSEGESPKIETDAVEALQLPSMLEELRIEGFPGVKLPLDSLDHLVNLELVNRITLKEVTTSKAVKTAISAKNCPKLTTTSNMVVDLQTLNM
ncbi:hypothetical protein Syun_006402 [Stephania yunnanensis]|uniref:R13L1/DRL21-like LRR repeat region domain-containing protein n=1 Tax=Stephania yunnanensis TaxID=152371 RepID=A0AAP0Q1B7_9MAGN